MYKTLLLLHILGATVWTGGHLVLALTILPNVLKTKDLDTLRRFEAGFEKVGIPALLIQIVTGIWLAYRLVPQASLWLDWQNPMAQLILFKLGLLLTTVTLAVDARLRIIPHLANDNLKSLTWHIVPVTVLSVLFVAIGVSFRTGGLF